MSRLRCKNLLHVDRDVPVVTPNSPARATILATPALQISFLLGRQLMFGQEPPIQRRSTTATFSPALRKMPRKIFAAFAAADDNDIILFCFAHRCFP